MELSSILREEMTLKIDKFYGKILIKIQICTNTLEKLTQLVRKCKFGLMTRSRDT